MSDSSPAPLRPQAFRPFAFLVLAGLGTALAGSLALRPLPEAEASPPPATQSSEAPSTPAPPSPGADDDATGASGASAKAAAAAGMEAVGPDPAAEPRAEPRPLRVVGLDWELVAPGVLANDGSSPGPESAFVERGLAVEFSVSEDIRALEASLARGAVDGGAEIAILPLPTFVASYERLRALDPEVFFVLGWSAGRDAVILDDPEILTQTQRRLPAHLEVLGEAGSASTFLALFALAEHGVDLDGVDLRAPKAKGPRPKTAARALERSTRAARDARDRSGGRGDAAPIDSRDLALTSADAPHLIPFVAVAPAGVVRGRTADLVIFSQLWLEGVEDLSQDAPKAARRVAAEADAPEAVELLNALAYLRYCDLDDSARAAGLAGRDAISVEALFQRSFSLWRAVGVLSTPAPEHAPLDNAVLAQVVLSSDATRVRGRARPRRPEERSGDVLLLVHRRPAPAGEALDPDALVEELGFLAGSFSRAQLELRVRGDRKASKAIVREAVERFDLDPEHVRVGPRLRGSDLAQIRVLVP